MTIVICTPGQTFTAGYVESFYNTIGGFLSEGVGCYYANSYSGDIYISRTRTVTKGGKAGGPPVIFGGKPYDYLVWIDSDMSWQREDIYQLISRDKDVISGMAKMGLGDEVAVGSFNERGDRVFGRDEDFEGVTEPVEVDFAGMGFLCMKAGVLESLEFPWFRSELDYQGALIGEDLSFCNRLKEKGYKIWVDPLAKVGHEKLVRLYPNGKPTHFPDGHLFRLPEVQSNQRVGDDVRGPDGDEGKTEG